MFTIQTARPGEAWHTLHPRARLGDAVRSSGYDCELQVAVRVDYGRRDDDGRPDPYQLKFWLVDSALGTRFELINHRELRRRHQFAADNGDTYDASDVEVNSGALFTYAERLEAHFRALMQLELFTLPVTM